MNAQVLSLLNSGNHNESYKLANERVNKDRSPENLQDRFCVLQAMIDVRLERQEIETLPRILTQMLLVYDACIDCRLTEKALKSIAFYLILQRKRYQQSNTPLKILNALVKIPHLTPSEVHSLILTCSLYYKSDYISYLEFAKAWGSMNFTSQDFQKRSNKDGKSYCSLVESYLAFISKCLESDINNNLAFSTTINPERWLQWVEFAEKQGLKSDLLPYYRSVIFKLNGQIEKAISSLKLFITHKPYDFWAWSRMAEFVEEKSLKISFLAKAIECPGPEEYKIRVHYKLGLMLYDDKFFSEALYQFETTIRISDNKEWAKPKDIVELIGNCREQTKQAVKTDYHSHSQLAEAFVFSGSKGIWAYVIQKPVSVKNTRVSFRNQKGIELEVHVTGGKNVFNHGELYYLVLDRRKEGVNKILYLSRFKEDELGEDLRIESGIIKKYLNNEYGFMADIFIPPYIFEDYPELKNGSSIKIVAQKAMDKKMKREGWRAIGILATKK